MYNKFDSHNTGTVHYRITGTLHENDQKLIHKKYQHMHYMLCAIQGNVHIFFLLVTTDFVLSAWEMNIRQNNSLNHFAHFMKHANNSGIEMLNRKYFTCKLCSHQLG